jgi:hypothetical protein
LQQLLQAKLQLRSSADTFPEASAMFLLADPSAHYCNEHYSFGDCDDSTADLMQNIFLSATQDDRMYAACRKHSDKYSIPVGDHEDTQSEVEEDIENIH